MPASHTTSIIKVVLDEIKSTFKSIRKSDLPVIDRKWKSTIALEALQSINISRFTKEASNHLKQRIKKSHETFTAALAMLENRHRSRITTTEERLSEVVYKIFNSFILNFVYLSLAILVIAYMLN